MLASLGAGLLMMVALAAVFVPRGLQNEGLPPIPRITLSANTTTSVWRFAVTGVTVARPLSEFRAEFVRAGVVLATISPLTDGAGNATLSFRDEDADGKLSLEDTFTHVSPVVYLQDALRIVWLPENATCGYWSAQP